MSPPPTSKSWQKAIHEHEKNVHKEETGSEVSLYEHRKALQQKKRKENQYQQNNRKKKGQLGRRVGEQDRVAFYLKKKDGQERNTGVYKVNTGISRAFHD